MAEVRTDPTLSTDLDALRELLAAGGVLVLSGAGLSTDSGIPDYRGPSGALRRHAPMTYYAFVNDPVARHRYWARSFLGWRQIAAARPNAGHVAVTRLQARGCVSGVITQNVDGLHTAAGSRDVVELHGGLDRTLCLDCGARAPREALDTRLRALNPAFDTELLDVNPDGDAELSDGALGHFTMADCSACGSELLKPDVVFFGENVPPARVQHCFSLVDTAEALLVLGSSLTVLSGFRFVRAAYQRGIPIAIVNQGPTRGDALADVRIDGPLGSVLTAVC